jgi:hypothetical protein
LPDENAAGLGSYRSVVRGPSLRGARAAGRDVG